MNTNDRIIMRALIRYIAEDKGQDLVEYALLSGAFGIAAVVAFNNFDNVINAVYTSWDGATQSIWRPEDPQ